MAEAQAQAQAAAVAVIEIVIVIMTETVIVTAITAIEGRTDTARTTHRCLRVRAIRSGVARSVDEQMIMLGTVQVGIKAAGGAVGKEVDMATTGITGIRRRASFFFFIGNASTTGGDRLYRVALVAARGCEAGGYQRLMTICQPASTDSPGVLSRGCIAGAAGSAVSHLSSQTPFVERSAGTSQA